MRNFFRPWDFDTFCQPCHLKTWNLTLTETILQAKTRDNHRGKSAIWMQKGGPGYRLVRMCLVELIMACLNTEWGCGWHLPWGAICPKPHEPRGNTPCLRSKCHPVLLVGAFWDLRHVILACFEGHGKQTLATVATSWPLHKKFGWNLLHSQGFRLVEFWPKF